MYYLKRKILKTRMSILKWKLILQYYKDCNITTVVTITTFQLEYTLGSNALLTSYKI
jgi:hypothetical protein